MCGAREVEEEGATPPGSTRSSLPSPAAGRMHLQQLTSCMHSIPTNIFGNTAAINLDVPNLKAHSRLSPLSPRRSTRGRGGDEHGARGLTSLQGHQLYSLPLRCATSLAFTDFRLLPPPACHFHCCPRYPVLSCDPLLCGVAVRALSPTLPLPYHLFPS